MTDTIIQKDKGEFSIRVSVMKYTNGDTHFVYCPSLDLYGYGSTLSKANKSFEIVLSEYMRYTTENETLDADLNEHGWSKKNEMSESEKALIEAESGQVTRYESLVDFKNAMETLVEVSLYDIESSENLIMFMDNQNNTETKTIGESFCEFMKEFEPVPYNHLLDNKWEMRNGHYVQFSLYSDDKMSVSETNETFSARL